MRRRLPRNAARALVLVLAAAFLLAGCGGSSSSGNGVASKSPDAIVAAAKAAADTAASAHISGSIVNEGTPLTLDIYLLSGKGGHGRITQNGLSFELIVIGETVYIYGSPAFLKHVAGAAAAQPFEGKWLKAPASSGNFGPLASLTDLRKLLDTTLANHGALTSAGTATIDGQPAVGVREPAKGGVLYVASSGPPFPLELVKSGAGGGSIHFDHWNQTVTLTPPTNAISLAQLLSGH